MVSQTRHSYRPPGNLTHHDYAVYNFFRRFLAEHGYPPLMAEIEAACHVPSAAPHLKHLERDGILIMKGKAYYLAITLYRDNADVLYWLYRAIVVIESLGREHPQANAFLSEVRAHEPFLQVIET